MGENVVIGLPPRQAAKPKKESGLVIPFDPEKYPRATASEIKFLKSGGGHAPAADVLSERFADIVFDAATDRFYRRHPGETAHRPVLTIFKIAGDALVEAAEVAKNDIISSGGLSPKDVEEIYSTAGKVIRKYLNRDAIRNALALYKELSMPATEDGAVNWNAAPECHALIDAVLDLSGSEPVTRQPHPAEYFHHSIPVLEDEFNKADEWKIPAYDDFIAKVYPDAPTRETSEFCMAAVLGNRGNKLIVICIGALANNAKDTRHHELTAELFPGRIVALPKDFIIKRGDPGVRRFGLAPLRGAMAAIVSELGDDRLSVAALKNLTNGAMLRAEEKGRPPFEFKQTAVPFVLTNTLPPCDPDQGFLNRLVVLPHNSVFYTDDGHRERLRRMGVPENHLFEQIDRELLFGPILKEHAGIIRRWSILYIALRDKHNRKIPESELCRNAKEAYRKANDLLEQFFIEHLIKSPHGAVKNTELESLWDDFQPGRPWPRGKLKSALAERFDFIGTRRQKNGWFVTGVLLKESDSFGFSASEEGSNS